jgi:hypothetical protein
VEGESWEETEPEEERDTVDEGTPAELLSVDLPEVNERALGRIQRKHSVRQRYVSAVAVAYALIRCKAGSREEAEFGYCYLEGQQ